MAVSVETTFPKSFMPRAFSVQLVGRHGRCFACLRLCKAIGTVLDQLEDTSWVALDQCPVQGGEALLVGRMDARAPSKKEINTLRKALVR